MVKVLEVLGAPATNTFKSLSHLWHKRKLQAARPKWNPFVSLSACLPCLATKPATSPSSPIPQPKQPETVVATQYSSPQVERVPSRPDSSGSPTPSPPSSTKSTKEEEATITTASSLPPAPPPAPTPPHPGPKPEPALRPEPEPDTPTKMAERTVQQLINQLKSNPGQPYPEASAQLSKAKLSLLQLGAATPTPTTPPAHLALAREVYEQGALFSIRARSAEAFTRYVAQLAPFYELGSPSAGSDERNKVTGLYLLLLLTQGRYAEFHSELEALGVREGGGTAAIENDRFLGYPVKLERWLMEGSYDRVWKSMKSREVPSEEYGVFSEILTSQIRSEIASSSERAYPSLPLSSTKSLLFLDSEGAVVDFARDRGWSIRDGHIYFPSSTTTARGEGGEEGETSGGRGSGEKEVSQMVIENTLGYARELETIV
ncbi:SAC3/GANP/Nin1/mts3/eIF-3 p25 family-domain-containing protein [Whalleya microplaca]|nr:SAC3/GANP/Nin1/mts3/eIF-3 p25 family-domain-containing protein [Whalleya microplaca]